MKKYNLQVRDKSTGRLLNIPLSVTSDGSLTVDPSREASSIIDENITPRQAPAGGSIGISDLHITSRTDGAQEHVGNIIVIDDVVQIIIIDVIAQ